MQVLVEVRARLRVVERRGRVGVRRIVAEPVAARERAELAQVGVHEQESGVDPKQEPTGVRYRYGGGYRRDDPLLADRACTASCVVVAAVRLLEMLTVPTNGRVSPALSAVPAR